MVYENALLFMRDMLNLQEIHSAVKRGDSGRIVLALKAYALSFRGAGRSHYAKETLNILHYVQKVWPAPLRNLILNNWLINTTGHPNSWIGLDLHQEHNNLFTKTVYRAHSSNFSWFWLATISPCVEALGALKRDLSGMFGRYLGTSHTSPDLTADIKKLMCSLDNENVYRLRLGRVIEGESSPVRDAESVGLRALLDGRTSRLKEYNKSFKLTQEAYRLPTVFEMSSHTSLTVPQHPRGSTSTAHPINLGQNSQDDVADNESGSNTSSEEEDFESGSEPEDESEGESEVQEGFADIDPTGDDPADEFFARARAIPDADGGE
ncbi:hypothetical protein FRC09_018433 [Ceratobasidium sp. 395]|nr:hypothetical protein FRC09_018433 [Ceratobasidium sp. 395]